MAYEVFAHNPTTTVSSGGTDAPSGGTSQSWTVVSSAPFPAAATGVSQFHVADPALPSELIAVTNVTGTTWTVTRGAGSTTPVAHTGGFTVYQVVDAGTLGTFTQAGQGDIGGTGSAPTVTATHLSAALPLAQGGTAATTQQTAIDSLAGGVNSGQYLRGNGTHVVLQAVQLADLPAGVALLAGATYTGAVAPAVFALTDAATITVDASKGNVFTVTLGGNRTLANPTNPVSGQTIHFHITQDATGGRLLTYGASYDFGTNGAPVLSTAATKVDILAFTYDGALTKWCYLGCGLGF